MSKVWVIALREYKAAVKTKAFIITMVLMPVLMGASGGVQYLFAKMEEGKEKKYVVIDRTPKQQLLKELEDATEKYNAFFATNPETGKQRSTKYKIVPMTPSEDTPEAKNQQRYEISQQIENGEYEAIVEIGQDVLKIDRTLYLPKGVDPEQLKKLDPMKLNQYLDSEELDDSKVIRFQAKSPGQGRMTFNVPEILNRAIFRIRLQERTNISSAELSLMQLPAPVKAKALTKINNQTGELQDGDKQTQILNLLLPAVLIGLMFMVIMTGATPAMQGVVEEKTLRISEVLLGSVSPFQLMAGKVIGVIGVSLTMAIVYLTGGYVLAYYSGFADAITPTLIFWFVVMLLFALMIFASLFLAVGAAASDIKDTQTLLMPIMIIAMVPFFALGPIIQEPNGTIARVCSFFPFATPMLLVARQSVPPGVPLIEMLAGILLVIVTTFICIYAAGRIFRVGILMQGKGAKIGDMIRWIFKG